MGFRLLGPEEFNHRKAIYTTQSYSTMGVPNSKRRAFFKKPNGELLYDVRYHFDSFGRRKTALQNSSSASLFFGCSYVFGEGLSDNETLPWIFSEKSKRQSYNYANRGYGPNNMLATLREHNLNKQIPRSIQKVDALFFSYPFHTERYLGSLRWIGQNRVNDPYFYLDEGELKDGGNFASGRPLQTFLYWSLFHFKIARMTIKDLGNDRGIYSQRLLCAIINESFLTLKKQLKNRLHDFYFVIDPFKNYSSIKSYYDGVKKCLDSRIKVITISPPKDLHQNKKDYVIDPVFDVHPSVKANEWLADQLLKIIGFKNDGHPGNEIIGLLQ